jgi:hypothetical protein
MILFLRSFVTRLTGGVGLPGPTGPPGMKLIVDGLMLLMSV